MEDLEKLQIEIRKTNDKEKLLIYQKVLNNWAIDDTIRTKENAKAFWENNTANYDLKLAYESASLLILLLLGYINESKDILSIKGKLIFNTGNTFFITLLIIDMVKNINNLYRQYQAKKQDILAKLEAEIALLKEQKEQINDLLAIIKEKIGAAEKNEIIGDIRTFLDTYGEPNLQLSIPELLKSYGIPDDYLNPEFTYFINLLNRYKYIKEKKNNQAERNQIIQEFRLIRKKNRK